MTNLAALMMRLTLQIERDLLAQKHLRTLLSDADTALLDRRRDLRNLKARMTSRSKCQH